MEPPEHSEPAAAAAAAGRAHPPRSEYLPASSRQHRLPGDLLELHRHLLAADRTYRLAFHTVLVAAGILSLIVLLGLYLAGAAGRRRRQNESTRTQQRGTASTMDDGDGGGDDGREAKRRRALRRFDRRPSSSNNNINNINNNEVSNAPPCSSSNRKRQKISEAPPEEEICGTSNSSAGTGGGRLPNSSSGVPTGATDEEGAAVHNDACIEQHPTTTTTTTTTTTMTTLADITRTRRTTEEGPTSSSAKDASAHRANLNDPDGMSAVAANGLGKEARGDGHTCKYEVDRMEEGKERVNRRPGCACAENNAGGDTAPGALPAEDVVNNNGRRKSSMEVKTKVEASSLTAASTCSTRMKKTDGPKKEVDIEEEKGETQNHRHASNGTSARPAHGQGQESQCHSKRDSSKLSRPAPPPAQILCETLSIVCNADVTVKPGGDGSWGGEWLGEEKNRPFSRVGVIHRFQHRRSPSG